ncbi:hypothetical protein KGQ34_03125 [Patescibacteria group bacterium]|nr:hypothetical protein [Patescibacteria group bacterium]
MKKSHNPKKKKLQDAVSPQPSPGMFVGGEFVLMSEMRDMSERDPRSIK